MDKPFSERFDDLKSWVERRRAANEPDIPRKKGPAVPEEEIVLAVFVKSCKNKLRKNSLSEGEKKELFALYPKLSEWATNLNSKDDVFATRLAELKAWMQIDAPKDSSSNLNSSTSGIRKFPRHTPVKGDTKFSGSASPTT